MKKIIILPLTFMLSLMACGEKPAPEPEKPAMPVMIDMIGLSKIEAEEWVTEQGINHDHVTYQYKYDEVIHEGKIMEQTVPAGTEISEDTMIGFIVSDGRDPNLEIEFPDFSTMSMEEIQKWFMDEDFEHVSLEYVYQRDVPYGQFVDINVKDGKARRRDHIVVTVTADPHTAGVEVIVPDMSTWTRAQVEEWCNMNTITPKYTYAKSASVPQNSVIRMEPGAQSALVKGDSISVVLSDGADITAVSFYGKSKQEIDKWGNDNGIKISYIQCWNAEPSGKIIWNKPDSGTIRMGETMQVYVSVGPIPVADYTGKLYNGNFMGWFNSINEQYNATANLKVQVTTEETTDQNELILEQNPKDGYINPNGTIYLKIVKHVDPKPVDNRVEIPYMGGYSEYDFIRSLHAYGVWEGERTERYSDVIAADYIINNDTGKYEPESSVNYTVSLGRFTLDLDYWIGRDIDDLERHVGAANRKGANVYLSLFFMDDHDLENDDEIFYIEGPMDDGMIHVGVIRFILGDDDDE